MQWTLTQTHRKMYQHTLHDTHVGLQELAKLPNVYCKVSGMFATDPKWDQRSVETVVKPCLEIFGMDRYVDP